MLSLVTELSPQECVRRCLEGETEAFGLLYDRFAGDVQRFLWGLGLGLDHQQLEDALQEAFLRLYGRLPKLEEPSRVILEKLSASNASGICWCDTQPASCGPRHALLK